ncbi:MAG TPA: hypothetical protein VG797_04870 [Phycisphaerales bacterium]|nr:hypothetical protein [Phycisphaerales bacterium]
MSTAFRPLPPPPPMSRTRGRRPAWVIGFILYALLMATGTHWPSLRIETPELPRADLLVHLCAFGTWTALFLAAGWFGPWNSWRNIAIGHLAAILYAGIDEASQGIPGLNRTVAWDDFAFNAIGVWGGTLLVTLVRSWRLERGERRLSDDSD